MNKFDSPYFNLHRNTSNWLKHLYPMLFGVTSFSISWLFFLLNLFGSVCMAPRKSNNPSCNLTCVIVFMHNAITTQSLSLSFSFLSLSLFVLSPFSLSSISILSNHPKMSLSFAAICKEFFAEALGPIHVPAIWVVGCCYNCCCCCCCIVPVMCSSRPLYMRHFHRISSA